MKILQKLMISRRINILLYFGAFFLLVIGSTFYYAVSTLAANIDRLASKDAPLARAVAMSDMMHDHLDALVYHGIHAYTYAQADKILALQADLSESKEVFLENMNIVIELLRQQSKKNESAEAAEAREKKISDLDASIRKYISMASFILENLKTSGANNVSQRELDLFQVSFELVEESLGSLGDEIEARLTQNAKDDLSQVAFIKVVFWISLILSLLFFIIFSRLISSSIADPISRMEPKIITVSHGDLRQGYPISPDLIDCENEIAITEKNLQKFIDRLIYSIQSLQPVSSHLEELSKEIDTNSSRLNTIFEVIDLSLKRFDMAVKSLASELQKNKGSVDQLSTQGLELREAIYAGETKISGTLTEIQDIYEVNKTTSTQIDSLKTEILEIRSVLNSINLIADQTKIIAFNAELEASSAGEVGKNFQIVATEIRRLAEHTVQFMEEVKCKIEKIEGLSSGLHLGVGQEGGHIRSCRDGVLEIQKEIQNLKVGHSFVEKSIKDIQENARGTTHLISTAEEQGKIAVLKSHDLKSNLDSQVILKNKLRSLAEKIQQSLFFYKIANIDNTVDKL